MKNLFHERVFWLIEWGRNIPRLNSTCLDSGQAYNDNLEHPPSILAEKSGTLSRQNHVFLVPHKLREKTTKEDFVDVFRVLYVI